MNALVSRASSTRTSAFSLAPTTFQEATQFATMLAKSDLVPRDYKDKPANIMVAMQWGAEIGLSPLQALQNISVINGRPSVWGDAALALVKGHPACEHVIEGVEGQGDERHGWCEVKRRGEPAQRRTFSMADAKRAGLAGKTGPWQQYPDRMLQLRARGFAIRDVFPDALRGVITAEEARDIPAEDTRPTSAMPPARGPQVDSVAEEGPTIVWTTYSPAGKAIQARDVAHWVKCCTAYVALLEDAPAVVVWRQQMDPIFADLRAIEPAAVAHVEGLAQDRMDELAGANTGETEEA